MAIKNLTTIFHRMSTARILAVGFAGVILCGTILLYLPISLQRGVRISWLQALFEATSAVCVTGLTVVPVGDTFNVFGRFIMAVLIQIGGMGIVLLGMMFVFLAGGKLGYKTRSLFVQAQNLYGYTQLIATARRILYIMFGVELAGMLLCWPVFIPRYGAWKGLGYAAFHSISAFNNAGFDIFGQYDSLAMYANNPWMIFVTSLLIIVGSFGFIAMMDLFEHHFQWKKLLLTTKIAIFMTVLLLVGGTLLFKWTTQVDWMNAWFSSVVTRTAGFSTVSLGQFTPAAKLVFVFLMFIGANPNSTGGGAKTTTIFVAVHNVFSMTAQHDENSVFHRRIPNLVSRKAFTVITYGILVILCGSFILLANSPSLAMADVVLEVTSAFATVGSSVGMTPTLPAASKLVLIVIMFIGRLGPVTIANLLITKDEPHASYTEENVLIG